MAERIKNRGDESTYDDCDVHTPEWAQVEPDFDPVETPSRLYLEIIEGEAGVVFTDFDPVSGEKILP